jgi:hypothetical protein
MRLSLAGDELFSTCLKVEEPRTTSAVYELTGLGFLQPYRGDSHAASGTTSFPDGRKRADWVFAVQPGNQPAEQNLRLRLLSQQPLGKRIDFKHLWSCTHIKNPPVKSHLSR